MSIKAVAWALDRDLDNCPGIHPTAKLVLIELAEGAHKADDCVWIGRPELARAALVKSLRTADKWVDWLAGAGLVEQIHADDLTPERRGEYLSLPPGKRPNIYRILWRTPAISARVTPAAADAPVQPAGRGATRGATTPANTPATAVAPKPVNQEPAKPAGSTSSGSRRRQLPQLRSARKAIG